MDSHGIIMGYKFITEFVMDYSYFITGFIFQLMDSHWIGILNMDKDVMNLFSSHQQKLVGGIPTPLKNISQLGLLFPIYGKIKNVPNHQLGTYLIRASGHSSP